MLWFFFGPSTTGAYNYAGKLISEDKQQRFDQIIGQCYIIDVSAVSSGAVSMDENQ